MTTPIPPADVHIRRLLAELDRLTRARDGERAEHLDHPAQP